MNKSYVFLISSSGMVFSEQVGERSYHDLVAGKLCQEEIDKNFEVNLKIHSDNAAQIVSQYGYLVVFDSPLYTIAMFPLDATPQQKTIFFNNFYSKNINLNSMKKEIEVGVRVQDTWEIVDNIEDYLNDFEFKIGGKK